MTRIVNTDYAETSLDIEGSKADPESRPVEYGDEKKFRILVIGDFSGRSWQDGESPERTFLPQPVDRDNFDDVLGEMRISLDLDGAKFAIRQLEDFHPDTLYGSPAFREFEIAEPSSVPEARAASAPAGFLDSILAEQSGAPARQPVRAEDANDLESFIRRATAGHVVPKESEQVKRTKEVRLANDSERMRAILHHSRFQAVESIWRALFMLVRGASTDNGLRIFLLDATLPELVMHQAEIVAELKSRDWSLLIGNYLFGQTARDAAVLSRLSALASELNAPFIAEAEAPGKQAPAQNWHALRQSEQARWIGLVLPRFLLRLPYGKETESIESFRFEEMPQSEHSAYLWGNPAFLVAYLYANAFETNGWAFAQQLERRIDGLPLHVYKEDGDVVTKPCAEVLMTEKAAEALIKDGFMPLASLKGQDAAMIVRYQSIALPPAPLPGL